jgi:uncharacterized membrane protein YoaK (UPF0700 family)
MFEHEGSDRTHRTNQILAGYLAAVAGYVNSAGFVLLGTFTSHVTGNVGRFADDLALHHGAAALVAILIVGYFSGAFLASMAIESDVLRRRFNVYGGLLLAEATLLAGFAGLSYVVDTHNPYFKDLESLLLCVAMGMQNSFVTRLSGAVVRTTHLTGVVTDLGIEAARWFRLWRHKLATHTRVRLVMGSSLVVVPHAARSFLLLTIFIAFVAGSAIGAIAALAWHQAAFLVPTLVLIAGGIFALAKGGGLDLRGRLSAPDPELATSASRQSSSSASVDRR